MANIDLTNIVFILDRSGSMSGSQEDVVGGFTQFIADQQKLDGEAQVTLAQFDDQYEVVYDGISIHEVPSLEFQPRGMTALHDAVGKTINTVAERINGLEEDVRPAKVIFVIFTDGFENSSKEFKKDQIKSLVESKQKDNDWQFVFLGADLDAMTEGGNIGVAAANSVTYDSYNTRGIYTTLSANVSNYRLKRAFSPAAGAASAVNFQWDDNATLAEEVQPES